MTGLISSELLELARQVDPELSPGEWIAPIASAIRKYLDNNNESVTSFVQRARIPEADLRRLLLALNTSEPYLHSISVSCEFKHEKDGGNPLLAMLYIARELFYESDPGVLATSTADSRRKLKDAIEGSL